MKKFLLPLLAVLAIAPDATAKTGDLLLGLSGNLWLAPSTKFSQSGFPGGSFDDKFSGGISLIADYAVWDYISVGGLFDVNGYSRRGSSSVKDTQPQISFMATARGYYPLGDRGQYMPYLRFAVGYTLFAPPISAPSGADPEHGWGVKVLPGFQYTFPFNLGVFAEIGWAGCGFTANSVKQMFHSAVINLGVSYTFGPGGK